MRKDIAIQFNTKFLIILLLIELITVPLVAISNPLLTKNFWTTIFFGFVIAAFGLVLLLRIIRNYLISNAESLFGVLVRKITNLWLIVVIAGILEMVMFGIQDTLFSKHVNVYTVGFISALGSVFCSLVVYKLCASLFKISITLENDENKISINFSWLNVIYLSFLFGVYEFIVCPITGWWIPYHGFARFGIAVLSAFIGAICGFLLMLIVVKLIKRKVYFYLSEIN